MTVDLSSLLLQHSPDASVATTPDGRVLYWADSAETLFGYTSAEATGHLLSELIVPPARAAELQRYADETLASGLSDYEAIHCRQDGSLLCVHVSSRAVHSNGNGADMLLSSHRDITQRKALRDAKLVEAHYHGLLESVPDGVVVVNATGHIVLINAEAAKLFGYDEHELRCRPIDTLLPHRFRAAHVRHRSAYVEQPHVRPMGAGLELFGLRRGGTEFPVEVRLSPLEMDDETLVVGAVRDLSERRKAPHQLAAEKGSRTPSEIEAGKEQRLADLSHDLRTSLNAIIGFTGTLLMGLPGPLNGDQTRQLRTVQDSAKHLLGMINNLLDITRADARQMSLHPQPVECARLIAELVGGLASQAQNKGLKLMLNMTEAEITIRTDRRALTHILTSLVANAIKFTDRGEVTVSVKRKALGAGSTLEIVVQDTGVGVAPADQGKLFHAFAQVACEKGVVRTGTGLGLYFSQQLAMLLGGLITFRARPEGGSEFTLTFTAA